MPDTWGEFVSTESSGIGRNQTIDQGGKHMKGFFVRWLIHGLSLVVVVNVISGIRVDTWQTTAVAALVLGLLNAFLRPFLLLFTLPINVLTLGLFTLVINAALFSLASWLVNGFTVSGFWNAFFGALVFSITSGLLNFLFNPDRDEIRRH
jgi:putative membrane protein